MYCGEISLGRLKEKKKKGRKKKKKGAERGRVRNKGKSRDQWNEGNSRGQWNESAFATMQQQETKSVESREGTRDSGRNEGWSNADVYCTGELGYLYVLSYRCRDGGDVVDVVMWLCGYVVGVDRWSR